MNSNNGAEGSSEVEALEAAIDLHRRGALDQASGRYRALLEVNPRNVDALHFLGVLLFQRGEARQGLDLVDRALALAPSYVDARNNRGNMLKELGRLEEAEKEYREVLRRAPEHADACNNLGVIQVELGRHETAVKTYLDALEARPGDLNALLNLGSLFWSMGHLEPAVESLRRAIEAHPGLERGYRSLVSIYAAAGRKEEALAIIDQWLDQSPEHPVAMHMRSAVKGQASPERASDAYITGIFDSFSNSFESVLSRLKYRAPSLILECFEHHWPKDEPVPRLCDAGCGTGLCGDLLRERVETLVGVDLSPGMLEKARGRNCYDALFEAELVSFLEQVDEPFDVIVSADTLCYFGNLEPAFVAAGSASRAGGLLLFTVESRNDGDGGPEGGYLLNPHGRYSHWEDYVADTLEATGWDLLEMTPVQLRTEGGKPVQGLVVAALRMA